MSPLPSNSHFISLKQAIEMTSRYRAERPNVLVPAFKDILLTCETFNRAAFDTLLAEADCAGIRVYFSMDEDLKIRIIAVAVNVNDEDILPADGIAAGEKSSDGHIIETGQPCPPHCPPPSALNG